MRPGGSVGLLLALVACSRAGDEQAAARRTPELPPPPTVGLPASIDIPVVIDGTPAEPITTARLARLDPDFADAERRAWRLARLVPGFGDGATVSAVSREGVSVAMRAPGAGDLVPVLFVTRRGDVIATLLDPRDPFPQYHGQGGRLGRPGDTTPRVSPVVRLELARPRGRGP